MTADVRSYTARWVFPVGGPPLPGGVVVVRGDRIAAVHPHGVLTADDDLGNAAIIPGLVNAHTHLDLSGARGRIPPTDPDHFTDWLKGVIAFRRTRTPEQTQADIRAGLAECLSYGSTLVGDIASDGASWDALSEAKTRAVVYREVIGLGFEWQDRYFDAHAWLARHPATPLCRPALSPHAPYTVRRTLFGVLAGRCRDGGHPTATHAAESSSEVEIVTSRTGPFVPFLAGVGFSEIDRLLTSFTELTETFDTGTPQLVVHGNYLPPDFAFRPNQSVAYCPRTHAAFGHPPHPFREFLARGVRVCLGTDSLASNPDLDVLAEARFVRSKYPDFPGDQLLKMVTLSGAEALGWADECGSLEPGKSADFVAVPLLNADHTDPHELLLRTPGVPEERRTLWRGEWR